ncbi:CYCLIN B1-5 [Trifolium repens]|nr:CYCLIN B1-5 [Trifolium repens]
MGLIMVVEADKIPTFRQELARYIERTFAEHNIDAGDANNELVAVEYLEDIYKFYKMIENESRPHDYMDSQPEIDERMRATLIDWLVDVHTKFDPSPETLYLTINIVDRFL